MKILIHGINYSPELTGIGKYTGEMATWLAQRGHEVRVVTAPPYYPSWRVSGDYTPWRYCRETREGVKVWRCPLYVPPAPKPLTRLLHLFSFAISSFPVMMFQVTWRPDIVLVIEPPLFCAPLALLTAFFSRAKSWLHVQDFEIAAFFGLGFSSSSQLEKICSKLEQRLMRCFDLVSSISNTMVARLYRLGIPESKSWLFPNWVDCAMIRPQPDEKYFRTEWNIAEHCTVVLYSGNMGRKQGLEIVIETAAELAHQYPDLLFVMVGDGAAKKELFAEANKLELQNVIFKPLQPLSKMSALLNMADIHLVIQKRGVADAVLPSKLNGIFAVGGFALVTADQDTELGRLISENDGIAMLVAPEDKHALAHALKVAMENPSLRRRAKQLAREYAQRRLDTNEVLATAENRLFHLVE